MMIHELQRAAVPIRFRPAMVECLRHCGIRDRRVLAAMATVPRISFLSDHLPDSASAAQRLSLPHDQQVLGSYTFAVMLEAPSWSHGIGSSRSAREPGMRPRCSRCSSETSMPPIASASRMAMWSRCKRPCDVHRVRGGTVARTDRDTQAYDSGHIDDLASNSF